MESVQNLICDLHDHVIELTRAGAFQRHAAARTVFDFFCQRVVANDSPRRGLVRGCVMPNCTKAKVIAQSTGLTVQGVYKAVRWLDNNGFIIQTSSVEIRTFDEESERSRQEWVKSHVVETEFQESETQFQPKETGFKLHSV